MDKSVLCKTSYYQAETIGGGDYGSICTVYDDDGHVYAKKDFIEVDYDLGYDLGILREISTLMLLRPYNNPYIIQLHDIYDDNGKLSMIMPKLKCDLLHAIHSNNLTSSQKLHIAHKICVGVGYLHANNIIHRDIKTENILLSHSNDPIIADFSLAKIFDTTINEITHTPTIGTDTFRAPEVIAEEGYGFPADMWSIGVVLLELFDGPLGVHRERVVMNIIKKKKAKLTNKPLPTFILGLLNDDPKLRTTYSDALDAPVFKKFSRPTITRDIEAHIVPPRKVMNREIKKIYEAYKFTNPMTMYAADIYRKFSSNIRACVILAAKMYEEELVYKDDVSKDISAKIYMKEEQHIFAGMQYCLFV